jgi:hypothetical protein
MSIQKILAGAWDNHVLPFFWQHGETEAVLRDYMRVIHDAGCGAVCVESRPHPDFCGPKWWTDMDIILDEARTRGMKVWILDDSHFPTGYANGAVENAPEELCRQSICANRAALPTEAQTVTLNLDGMIPPPFSPTPIEQYILPNMPKPRLYHDDSVLFVNAFCPASKQSLDLMPYIKDNVLRWEKPEGAWTVWVCGLSRNCGTHRNYINMLKAPSVKLLLDAVYELHWRHYREDFGKTIAGFFSDEPELGNGHMFAKENVLGTDQDLPFSDEMPAELEKRLGPGWAGHMYLLWENDADDAVTAKTRYAYMDAVTKLVRKDFSYQVSDWCRAHAVEYIGHIIEDDGTHARTATGIGHFFRGLAGQDMSGIDDIGGQVFPQGEDDNGLDWTGQRRHGDFYHFLLGRLASSAAAIEPRKKGRALCEIFGNYGWTEGVKLEKYLADHFMVRGVNYFVPHAFSPKAFPDPDCPPHFYAQGHNPQYRHFGALMRYMNRVCTLISAGNREAEAAVLYHAEAEWSGTAMPSEKPARVLEEHQINFDILPCDVFAEPDQYQTKLGKTLRVNTQTYKALIVPAAQFITSAVAKNAALLHNAGMPVIFIDTLPEGVCDGDDGLLAGLQECPVLPLEELAGFLAKRGMPAVQTQPASGYVRALHRTGETDLYYFVNEAKDVYTGTITVPTAGPCSAYNAWENRLEPVEAEPVSDGTRLHVTVEPLKSLIVIFDDANVTAAQLYTPPQETGEAVALSGWTRATCEGAKYPRFGEAVPVTLPDTLAEEQPEFSGFVRYASRFTARQDGRLCLVISDAAEGVEVLVNGKSAGLQIAPPFRYDLSALSKPGENELVIEVATTLERQCYPLLDQWHKMKASAPSGPSGLCGTVKLLYQKK